MEKVFKIIIRIVIPTLFMCYMVNNMFIARTEGGCMEYFTIFTFLFAITVVMACLIWRIEKLEQKVKEMEQNLNNE